MSDVAGQFIHLSLLVGLAILRADPKGFAAQTPGQVVEYTDNEYGFAFQYPSDWKVTKVPSQGGGDGVRVTIESPRGSILMATVGTLPKPMISKRKFDASPKKDAVRAQIIDFTVQQVYERTSRDIGAEKMIVREKRAVPSEVGLAFYISALYVMKGGTAVLLTGRTGVAFESRFLISFLIIALADGTLKQESTDLDHAFQSFHLLGEKPQQEPKR